MANVGAIDVVTLTVLASRESNQTIVCDKVMVEIRINARKLLVFFLKRNLKDIGYMFMD